MVLDKIRRSEIRHFLNITPESPHVLGSSSATYARIGKGVTAAMANMNAKITEETYVAEDVAQADVDAYAPTLPVEMTAMRDDPVFDYVDQLRLDRAVGEDAESDIVNVWAWEAEVGGEFPAEQQRVSIAVDEFGGAGGESNKLNYTINYLEDPVPGTFNPTTGVFAAT